MFGSDILEVAIGVIFVWLLLSLACSAANELIASWLAWRANYLAAGLRSLLHDPEVATRLYAHPLIAGLCRDGQRPAYIPSRAFALALMDDIIACSQTPAGQEVVAVIDPATRDNALDDIRATISRIDDTFMGKPLKQALLTVIGTTGNAIDKVERGLEDWFNDTMERASGWYKQRTQWVLLMLAFLFTLLMNLDTIAIADTLSRNATLRQALVQAATQEVGQTSPGTNTSSDPYGKLSTDLGKIEGLGLPIGWAVPDNTFKSVAAMVTKIVGLLLTVLAASLGAPFWFDVLNKIIRLRTSLKPSYDTPPGQG